MYRDELAYWTSNDTSSDNSSGYKYGHADRSSVQTAYLDNSSEVTDELSKWNIGADDPSVCPYLYTDELSDELSLLAQLVSISSINRAIKVFHGGIYTYTQIAVK